MDRCKEFLKHYRKVVGATDSQRIDKRYKPYLAPNDKTYQAHCGHCAEVEYLQDISGDSDESSSTSNQPTKDEVDSIEMVESQSYASRKGKTYELIGSKSADWESAYIKGYVFKEGKGEVPIYHIGSITKKPFPHKVIIDGVTKDAIGTSITVNDDGHLYSHQETQHTAKGIVGLSTGRCELCGHPIKYEHILINHKDKKYMVVGSECVHHSQGAVVRKAIKKFKDNEIRQEFTEIRPKAIAILDTKKDKSSDWAIRQGRIEYWAYKMKEELTKIEPEKTGSRKLKNRIETIKKLIAEANGGEKSLTPTQEKQIKWCQDAVSTESSYKLRTYHIDCKDCGESKSFHSAMTCVDFIHRHIGHQTWIQTEGSQDALTIEKQYEQEDKELKEQEKDAEKQLQESDIKDKDKYFQNGVCPVCSPENQEKVVKAYTEDSEVKSHTTELSMVGACGHKWKEEVDY